jgi:hypothetical protein
VIPTTAGRCSCPAVDRHRWAQGRDPRVLLNRNLHMCLVLLVRHHIGRVTVVSTVQLPPSLYLPTSKVHRLRRVCVCVCVCFLLWPCTPWVWAVTMCQLCTFCHQPPAPVQKPTMRPADRISNTMLNIGKKEKVIRYRMLYVIGSR